VNPRHAHITRLALAAAGEYGFALAGGYAISAHGMGDRPSGDVDLFTDWHRRADFPAAVDAVIEALVRHHYAVTPIVRNDTFARLLLTAPGVNSSADQDKLELSVGWRAHPPVMLAVGPVLHPDAMRDRFAQWRTELIGKN
jgi:Nucleotidyl transferase AbiEii toxin, Type IV TA system